MNTQLVDVHTHLCLADREYSTSVDERLQAARDAGLETLITIGTDSEDNLLNAEQARRNPGFVNIGVGIHPCNVRSDGQSRADLQAVRPLIDEDFCCCIGETGLDAYWDDSTLDAQMQSFERHIELALQTGKPLMIHCRDAYEQMLPVLRQYQGRIRGVIHCFTEDDLLAMQLVDLGFHISFPGIVTFPRRVERIQSAARAVPADRILVETDAPYLAPQPWRGRENQSAYIVATYERIAELRGTSLQDLVAQVRCNVQEVFGI